MKCKIYFFVNSVKDVETSGNLYETGKNFVLDYNLGDDECRITGVPHEIKQTRKGSLNLEIDFSEGKITQCKISEGGLHGSLPVFTKEILTFKDGEIFNLKLYYEMNGEDFNLEILAVPVREKK